MGCTRDVGTRKGFSLAFFFSSQLREGIEHWVSTHKRFESCVMFLADVFRGMPSTISAISPGISMSLAPSGKKRLQ